VVEQAEKALPYLRDGASVMLVGSDDADKQGRVGTSKYIAAKAAVRSFSMSAETLSRHIRVNVLGPGMTPEQIAAAITKTIQLGRRGTPEEMAKAILFLASDDSFSQLVSPG
jgi:NAD(P)-dependent dehydrogenase (short-subunit alcohol dehydrogenase family)